MTSLDYPLRAGRMPRLLCDPTAYPMPESPLLLDINFPVPNRLGFGSGILHNPYKIRSERFGVVQRP